MRRVVLYPNQREWLELSLADSPQANLRIGTISGLPYFVDWGDGNIEVYTNSQIVTKVYSTNYTGKIRIATPMGLGDVDRIEISDNLSKYNFDATALSGCVNMAYLRLQGSLFAGDMSVVSDLTSLIYLRLTGGSFTGDMSGVSALTSLTTLFLTSNLFTGDMSSISQLSLATYLYITGNFTINYTSTTFAPSFQYFLFRPTTTINPLSSEEIDQLLIDASQTTWGAGSKIIYADGNNGVRTSASDSAVATLQAMGVTLILNV